MKLAAIIIIGISVITAVLVVSASMLSAMISERERERGRDVGMTVCLTFAAILGTYCAPNATIPPAAECVWYGDGAHCHVTEVTSIAAVSVIL